MSITNFINGMDFLSPHTKKEMLDGYKIGLQFYKGENENSDKLSIEDELQGNMYSKTLDNREYKHSKIRGFSVDGKPAIIINDEKAKNEINKNAQAIYEYSQNYSKSKTDALAIEDADITSIDNAYWGQQGLIDLETSQFLSYILMPYYPKIDDANRLISINFVQGNKYTTRLYLAAIAHTADYSFSTLANEFTSVINTSSSLMTAQTMIIETGVKFNQVQQEKAAIRRFNKIGLEKAFAPEYMGRLEDSITYAGFELKYPDNTSYLAVHGIANAKGTPAPLSALNGGLDPTKNTVSSQDFQSIIDNVSRGINETMDRLLLQYSIATDGITVEKIKGKIRVQMSNALMKQANTQFNPVTKTISALMQLQIIFPNVIFETNRYLSERIGNSNKSRNYIWRDQPDRMLIIIEPADMKQRFVWANAKTFTEEWSRTNQYGTIVNYDQRYFKGIGDILLGTPACTTWVDFGVDNNENTEIEEVLI